VSGGSGVLGLRAAIYPALAAEATVAMVFIAGFHGSLLGRF